VTRARVAGIALALVAALATAPPAHATDVTAAELSDLASRAIDDPAALAELRRVDSVDGRPADVRGTLAGVSGEELDGRLETLSASATQPVPGGVDPRAEARDVLSDGRYSQDSPRPLAGLIEWLDGLVPDGLLDWLDDLLPGGRSVVWIVLGAICALIAWFVGRRILTRRVRASAEAQAAAAEARDDPRALEREADAAEAAGDLERALRLRFRAGLLRLDARGAIEYRPSISTREVSRKLHSDDFDALALTFDDVVYGGRPAQDADVSDSRDRWPAVVAGGGER
jgi:hypothetical protein